MIASPYDLAQADEVVVILRATNAIGTSADSSPSNVNALIELVPHKPPVAPVKNSGTT